MDNDESTMHEPTTSPIAMEWCPAFKAFTSTANSGSEVPILNKKKLKIYEGTASASDIKMMDSTIAIEAAVTPAKPISAIKR